MPKFHTKYTNIHRGVLRATQQLFACDMFSSPEEVIGYFNSWTHAACEAYNVSEVRVQLVNCELFYGAEGGGYHTDDDGEHIIVLTRPSLLWLFHQFRHHLQKQGRVEARNEELDAHAWSCSLFHTAQPEDFRYLVYQGAIAGVRMQDLDGETAAPASPGPEDVTLIEAERQIFEDISTSIIEELEPDSEFAQLLEQIAEEE